MYKTLWQQIAVQQVSDARKTQGEHERASNRSNSHRGRRCVRRPRALIFPWKNRNLADFAAGIRRIPAKSGSGGRGGEASLFCCVGALCKTAFPTKYNAARGTFFGRKRFIGCSFSFPHSAANFLVGERSSCFSNFFHDSCLAQASLPFVPSIIARLAASNPLRCRDP